MLPLANTLPQLAGKVRDTVATVTLDLLNNVWPEIEYRLYPPGHSRCPH
jgi:hypothetical protein